MPAPSTFDTAAYGNANWQSRDLDHGQEIGSVWGQCGIDSEWGDLRAVLLHCPGPELSESESDPEKVQMLAPVDWSLAAEEHARLAETYRQCGVEVFDVQPRQPASPNQMFCADLFAMTPQGAILARPASTVRAGEEVQVARRLTDLEVPILRTLTGNATFEGADLIWITAEHALLGLGLRTNIEAAEQIAETLDVIGVELSAVDMPFGTMHLMGMLRIVSRDLALAWPRRTPHRAVTALRESGYRVEFLPEHDEFDHGKAFNFVTLGAMKILMVGNNPFARDYYESLGIECVQTPATELSKAAGAVGCLTGVLEREKAR